MNDYSVPPATDYIESVRESRRLKRKEKIQTRKVEIAKVSRVTEKITVQLQFRLTLTDTVVCGKSSSKPAHFCPSEIHEEFNYNK